MAGCIAYLLQLGIRDYNISFCQSFYTCSLWVDYTQKSLSALRVQYNNIFRIMLGLPRHCSASGMFAENRVDGFFAIMRKRIASTKSRLERSSNIVLRVIADRQDSAIKAHWVSALVSEQGDAPMIEQVLQARPTVLEHLANEITIALMHSVVDNFRLFASKVPAKNYYLYADNSNNDISN